MKVMVRMRKHINVVSWCFDGLKENMRNQSTATIAAKILHQYLHTREGGGGEEGKEKGKGEEQK